MMARHWKNGAVLAACLLLLGSTVARAGGLVFTSDSLNASASTSDASIFVFAQRTQDPSGTSGFAVFSLFDLSTFEFTQCVSANFSLHVIPNGATLSFVTDGGFNCPAGETVVASCAVTSNSGSMHNVTNGTAKLPIFQQQYTTHGESDSYTDLTCRITAFGVQAQSDGGAAATSQSVTTP
jgi:hypothetical protein